LPGRPDRGERAACAWRLESSLAGRRARTPSVAPGSGCRGTSRAGTAARLEGESIVRLIPDATVVHCLRGEFRGRRNSTGGSMSGKPPGGLAMRKRYLSCGHLGR
jgi:hypothetical protein